MTAGPLLFGRFAFPPNALGYCGPADVELLHELVSAQIEAGPEIRHAATAFAGAWPYLSLIGATCGRDPLDAEVVEAYWIGNHLLDSIDTLMWGNSLDDRFRIRAGGQWGAIETAINGGGVPSHAFHVFCVYPWIGLLRSGMPDPALRVLEQCRIRWGRVLEVMGDRCVVRSRPLEWDGCSLSLGAPRAETVDQSIDAAAVAAPGDTVAMHWNYVCQPITAPQRGWLAHNLAAHIAIVNTESRRLAAAVGA